MKNRNALAAAVFVPVRAAPVRQAMYADTTAYHEMNPVAYRTPTFVEGDAAANVVPKDRCYAPPALPGSR